MLRVIFDTNIFGFLLKEDDVVSIQNKILEENLRLNLRTPNFMDYGDVLFKFRNKK